MRALLTMFLGCGCGLPVKEDTGLDTSDTAIEWPDDIFGPVYFQVSSYLCTGTEDERFIVPSGQKMPPVLWRCDDVTLARCTTEMPPVQFTGITPASAAYADVTCTGKGEVLHYYTTTTEVSLFGA